MTMQITNHPPKVASERGSAEWIHAVIDEAISLTEQLWPTAEKRGAIDPERFRQLQGLAAHDLVKIREYYGNYIGRPATIDDSLSKDAQAFLIALRKSYYYCVVDRFGRKFLSLDVDGMLPSR